MKENFMKRPVPAQKLCPYCGKLYTPYVRTAAIQKTCGKAACIRKHKLTAHKSWMKRNPGCYRGRYLKVKAWLAAHPGYLARYRAEHPEYIARDNAGRCRRRHKLRRFRADIQETLLRRRILRIRELKGADIQETLRLKVDGILGMMSG